MLSSWFDQIREIPILDVLSFLGYNHYSNNGKSQIRSACILPHHPGPNKTGTAFSIDTTRNVWYCHGCQKGGGNIELVKEIRGGSTIESANFIAENKRIETYEELTAASPEEKEAFRQKLEEQDLVCIILTIAAHHFHELLTPELRRNLLIPQGTFAPKHTWRNLYKTWGLTDEAIEQYCLGFDDGTTLLQHLREKGYNNSDILKSGLFYCNEYGDIGQSVFKNRLTFPYMENGLTINFIARSTERTWPCYEEDPGEALKQNSFGYRKYKKLPQHDPTGRPYVSQVIQSQLFGISEMRRKKHAVIVEGVPDVILCRMFFSKMEKAGIKAAYYWAAGSFLSNQGSHRDREELSLVAKK